MRHSKLLKRITHSGGKVLVILLCFFAVACSDAQQQSPSAQQKTVQSLCNQAWFEKVDRQITSGDSQGHGPDLGSIEWRSVVEFKLGVRGDESLPAVDSDPWCAYIDQYFIK
ncbi:hypothetical protein JK628_16430 [Shewanella sp. KX20019]|uniref:hypothetical protein n=1 Tax=Shewanella sp. KX20019 TaxID=2803864 RepID=UPI0019258F1D|nr:hypothetical protein [Shewanella sp. KX20019]QQX82675.1 hypothetical protein JK628_16430 [Shewanella sp. KX20019]